MPSDAPSGLPSTAPSVSPALSTVPPPGAPSAPTNNLIPSPTDIPTSNLSDVSTAYPTDNPTHVPTDSFTPSLARDPIPSPSKIYLNHSTIVPIYRHNLTDESLYGSRNSLLSQINLLECEGELNIDFDCGLKSVVNDLILNAFEKFVGNDLYDFKTIVMFVTCSEIDASETNTWKIGNSDDSIDATISVYDRDGKKSSNSYTNASIVDNNFDIGDYEMKSINYNTVTDQVCTFEIVTRFSAGSDGDGYRYYECFCYLIGVCVISVTALMCKVESKYGKAVQWLMVVNALTLVGATNDERLHKCGWNGMICLVAGILCTIVYVLQIGAYSRRAFKVTGMCWCVV